MALMSTSEVADRCGVSSRTVLRWLTQGDLVGVRTPGGHWRVEEAELEALQGDAESEDVGGATVLIIEDNATEAQALATLVPLLVPEARTEWAEDGVAAGLLLGTLRPRVAFVDIEMPRLDGEEVIRRAREIPVLDDTHFVVVSGRLTPERIEALEALGVQDILSKPVNPREVRMILSERLQQITAAEVT